MRLMELEELRDRILEILKIEDFRYVKETIKVVFQVNRLCKNKKNLRAVICNKCKTLITVINKRSSCCCKRYIPHS